jgi:hypothetical protein
MSSVSSLQYSNRSIVFNSNTSPYPISNCALTPNTGFSFAFCFRFLSSLQLNAVLFYISQSNSTNFNGTSISNITNNSNFFYLQYTALNTFTFYYQSNLTTAITSKITSVVLNLNPDQIYNIVITYDTITVPATPTMKTYIDSIIYNSIATPTVGYLPASGNYNFNFLGGYPASDGTFAGIIPFVGNIYSFAIYQKSLTTNDVIQCFSTDLSLTQTSIASTSATTLANPKLSLTYQLSNPQYNNTYNIPIFDAISKSILFRGNNYLQYCENLNFATGFTIFIKFQFTSFHMINNETLITLIQNNLAGNNQINMSQMPIPNSIIIQRYGTTNNLLVNFILPNGLSSSSIITKNSFSKGITYTLTITFDGVNVISIYVNGNLDTSSSLLI